MINQIAADLRPNPVSGLMAYAVTPAARTPNLPDHPQPPPAKHSVSIPALAPAAMTVLIEALERLSQEAPALARRQTVVEIDQLIYQLSETPQGTFASAPMTVRQLRVIRGALCLSLIDLQA